MKRIPTTTTTVEKIKASARTIQHTANIPYLTALERASTDAGFDSWFHVQWCRKQTDNDTNPVAGSATAERDAFIEDARAYMTYLARKGQAPVTLNPVKGDIFHEVEIEGACFLGGVGIDGPAIIRRSPRFGGYDEGWVQLGVSEIHYAPKFSSSISRAFGDTPIGHEWSVCKYGEQEPRICIDDLSDAGRHALAHEFGIELYPPEMGNASSENIMYPICDWYLFYLSPAFQSLCIWAKKHPRKIRNCGGTYLGLWVEAALAGEYVFRDK